MEKRFVQNIIETEDLTKELGLGDVLIKHQQLLEDITSLDFEKLNYRAGQDIMDVYTKLAIYHMQYSNNHADDPDTILYIRRITRQSIHKIGRRMITLLEEIKEQAEKANISAMVLFQIHAAYIHAIESGYLDMVYATKGIKETFHENILRNAMSFINYSTRFIPTHYLGTKVYVEDSVKLMNVPLLNYQNSLLHAEPLDMYSVIPMGQIATSQNIAQIFTLNMASINESEEAYLEAHLYDANYKLVSIVSIENHTVVTEDENGKTYVLALHTGFKKDDHKQSIILSQNELVQNGIACVEFMLHLQRADTENKRFTMTRTDLSFQTMVTTNDKLVELSHSHYRNSSSTETNHLYNLHLDGKNLVYKMGVYNSDAKRPDIVFGKYNVLSKNFVVGSLVTDTSFIQNHSIQERYTMNAFGMHTSMTIPDLIRKYFEPMGLCYLTNDMLDADTIVGMPNGKGYETVLERYDPDFCTPSSFIPYLFWVSGPTKNDKKLSERKLLRLDDDDPYFIKRN